MRLLSPNAIARLAWLWKHTGAGIAALLILAALVVGYRVGRGGAEPVRVADGLAHAEAPADARPMYTCSMHPSVRLADPNAKCPICQMDLIPVTDADRGGGDVRLSMSEAAATLSRIETAEVARFFPTAEVRLYGKVAFDETTVARLTPYFPGRIDRLFVNYVGVPVALGDHIAELYSPELLAAFEELRQAKAASDTLAAGSELLRSATRDTLAATREKLRLFGVTPEQIASVEDGTFDSDRLTIFAPIGGVVTHLAVREGDYVQTGAPLATIADLSRLWLDMEAYESQLPLLRWGQRVTFTVEAHPGETFEGWVSFIAPTVDDRTRTAAVRVAVDNTDQALKPGMFASAVVRTRVSAGGAVASDEFAGRWVCPMHPTVVRDDSGPCGICGMDTVPAETLGVVGDPDLAVEPLVIPRTAVLFTGVRSVVYVEVPGTEEPTYEGREVVLGPRAGEFYIVRDGLSRGERVVVNGAFRIDSAMQIAAKPSMMTPAASAAPTGAPMAGTPGPSGVEQGFVVALGPVYAAYLEAQEALAADDYGRFEQAAQGLRAAFDSVDDSGLVGEPRATWRQVAARQGVDDAVTGIDAARERFESLSRDVIALQRRFGRLGSESLQLAHCPMAFDGEGADWLQRGTEINNPYYGDAMLRCGEIRESFEPIAPPAGGPGHETHGGAQP